MILVTLVFRCNQQETIIQHNQYSQHNQSSHRRALNRGRQVFCQLLYVDFAWVRR